MRRFAVLVVALLVALPGSALAARTKTLRTTGVIHGHDAEPAAADGSFTFAGTLRDSVFGAGAIVTKGTVQGLTSTGTFTSFARQGILRGTFELDATLNPDATVSLTGTTRIKGGSGPYRRAHGTGTLTGTIDAEGYTTFDYANTLKVPRP